MSALVPPAANERFEPPALDLGDHRSNIASSVRSGAPTTNGIVKSSRWARRTIGLFLLTVTIFAWTSTNFLASSIFSDDTYSKPYLVTYVNTAFFIIPLIPILIKRWRENPEALRTWIDELRMRAKGNYSALKQEEGDNGRDYHESPILRSTSALLDEPVEGSQVLSGKDLGTPPSAAFEAPLTVMQTARLSLEFCPLWFLANYFVAACLQYTTVASSTILTSTSSVFTLIFGAMFRVERFTVRKLLGVLASLAGITLISCLDLSGKTNDDEHRGDFPQKSLKEIAIGDFIAFLSAVMYGLYAVFMKKRIGDESKVDMPLFFGFVGLINVLIAWPGLIILHYTGAETFQLPPTGEVTLVVFLNSAGSLIGDIAWAYAVLLTSPIVVTVGLSLTIPLSLIGQIILDNQRAGPWYWLGAFIVVLSFLFINHEEKKDDEVPTPAAGEGPSAERQDFLAR
ncbi:hypothetical protein CKM354_000800200 [Cercospora kikuchii]|uniref:DUF3955 domain-containing protein n=1 Tax=Cercospora kikuchii TaxID=84275 RepID=A0A9P3CS90_9PEZI|nr:uncharacterized protein CKM354_000800200 [Cercospora kikuchii]GIZ44815.1 hypothetical protein CKM354_000800200 [Cercospora kikuchii]